ncbi:MAG: caspase family protein [Saprospiraceae bacterium]|nr:caspase family protein [Saprospiraceae bacterium]
MNTSAVGSLVILPSRPITNGVKIEWISPSPADGNIPTIDGKVELRIRIVSSSTIDMRQIDIYLNGKVLSNKADEVSLLKRADYQDQIMTVHVPMEVGNNAVQVVVVRGSEEKYFNERVLVKDVNGIRFEPAPVTGTTRITWIEPDAISLGGEMYSSKLKELPVRLNITTPENLTMENLQIVYNGNHEAPSGKASLLGQNGSYVFRDLLTLDENVDINEFILRATTPGSTSESEKLMINYSPVRPNVYLLSIGAQLNLKYAEKDARDFARLYAGQGSRTYKLFNNITVDTLLGAAAVTSEIRGMIETIKNKFKTGQISDDDLVMIFISSHGFIDERGDFRIQGSDYMPERKSTTSVSYRNDILAYLDELPCKKLILIDACHSGGARSNSSDILNAIQDIKKAPRGFAILSSSSRDEESYEDVKWQNGAFTEGLISGLKEGRADEDRNGIISLMELEKYLKSEVPNMVKEIKNKPQNPLLTKNDIGDLPIFILE